MGDSKTIVAKTIGTPSGGKADNPWPSGHPSEGERVAIFAFDVTSVDADAAHIRTYHVAPVDLAKEGAITQPYYEPQGVTVQWMGCGTGTVVRPAASLLGEDALSDDPDRADEMFQCEVRPDDMRFIQT
jgi:hypothetical protein